MFFFCFGLKQKNNNGYNRVYNNTAMDVVTFNVKESLIYDTVAIQ